MPVGRDTVTITKSAVARAPVDDSLTTTGPTVPDILRVVSSREVGESGLDKRFYEHR
jgi:hypothetical protein